MLFLNREDAGRRLARMLAKYACSPDAIVLGIPRGGVAVAQPIARELRLPLDVFLSQKLGVPGHEELAFGAVSTSGTYLNESVTKEAGLSDGTIDRVTRTAREKLERHEKLFRRGKPPLDVRSRIAILVDDGAATGASFHAALEALRSLAPKRLVAALPVAPKSVCDWLRSRTDELVCIACPREFYAVGEFYKEFTQISDESVIALLHALHGIDGRTSD